MNRRCFRCGRVLLEGDGVLEVRVAHVRHDELTSDRSERLMHAVCPANPTQRLN